MPSVASCSCKLLIQGSWVPSFAIGDDATVSAVAKMPWSKAASCRLTHAHGQELQLAAVNCHCRHRQLTGLTRDASCLQQQAAAEQSIIVLTAILWANSAVAIAVEPSLGALAAGLEVTAQYILVRCTLQATGRK